MQDDARVTLLPLAQPGTTSRVVNPSELLPVSFFNAGSSSSTSTKVHVDSKTNQAGTRARGRTLFAVGETNASRTPGGEGLVDGEG